MSTKVWIRHVLHVSFLLGTISAAALWGAALTAKCEGFGCLCVGAIVGMAFIVQIFSAIIGGLLIWLQKTEGKIHVWLLNTRNIAFVASLVVCWPNSNELTYSENEGGLRLMFLCTASETVDTL